MGGIVFTVPVQVVPQPVVAVFLAAGDFIPQVMMVAAGTVDNAAHHTLTNHVQNHQLPLTVAAVFQHHAGNTGFLVGFHQLPAFLQRVGAANLKGGVFSGLHGLDGQIHMGFPGGGNDDSLDFGNRQDFFGAFGFQRTLPGDFFHNIGTSGGAIRVGVVHSRDLRPKILTGGKNGIFNQRLTAAA